MRLWHIIWLSHSKQIFYSIALSGFIMLYSCHCGKKIFFRIADGIYQTQYFGLPSLWLSAQTQWFLTGCKQLKTYSFHLKLYSIQFSIFRFPVTVFVAAGQWLRLRIKIKYSEKKPVYCEFYKLECNILNVSTQAVLVCCMCLTLNTELCVRLMQQLLRFWCPTETLQLRFSNFYLFLTTDLVSNLSRLLCGIKIKFSLVSFFVTLTIWFMSSSWCKACHFVAIGDVFIFHEYIHTDMFQQLARQLYDILHHFIMLCQDVQLSNQFSFKSKTHLRMQGRARGSENIWKSLWVRYL